MVGKKREACHRLLLSTVAVEEKEIGGRSRRGWKICLFGSWKRGESIGRKNPERDR